MRAASSLNYQANCGSDSTTNSEGIPGGPRNLRSNKSVFATGPRSTTVFGGGRMADRTESSSSMVTQQGMSETNRVTTGAGSARSVVAEFMDAARSTAESLIEEQKQQIADRVKGLAEGLEAAARSLGGSQNRIVARYVQEAGDQVRNFSHSLHGRRWNELLADTRSEEHTSELQSHVNLVCRLLL